MLSTNDFNSYKNFGLQCTLFYRTQLTAAFMPIYRLTDGQQKNRCSSQSNCNAISLRNKKGHEWRSFHLKIAQITHMTQYFLFPCDK